MDISAFNEAQEAYTVGNYSVALEKFIECAQDLDGLSTEDLCKFYHLLGNCYVKNGKASVAAAAYSMALERADSKRKPALYVNLGKALLSSGKNTEALVAFNNALQFEDYATPHKAYSGIGAAQLQLGNTAEAGAAYREAAVDASNPAPAKSLVNLGACFMEMGRPEDAIISYETALDIGLEGEMQNKANENLGQAYMAQGRFFDAIVAFEDALSDGTYELSELADHDYKIAISLDERFGQDLEQLYADKSDELFDDDGEILPPYQTGEINLNDAIFDENADVEDLSAAETVAFSMPEDALQDEQDAEDDFDERLENSMFFSSPEDEYEENDNMFEPSQNHYANASEDAFESTPFQFDDENQWQPQPKRKKKHGPVFVIVLIVVILLVLAAAGAVAGYSLGYGYPLQETVAKDFFGTIQTGGDTSQYWAQDVKDEDKTSQLESVSNLATADVVAVQRSMQQSTVYVKTQLQAGGQLYYKVVMKRDKLSWAVEYFELYFPNAEQN